MSNTKSHASRVNNYNLLSVIMMFAFLQFEYKYKQKTSEYLLEFGVSIV